MLDLNLIDTAAFTQGRQIVSGNISLAQLDERVWSHELLANRDDEIRYRINGGIDRWQRPFFDIDIEGVVQLVCQRCLKPVSHTLHDQTQVVLFANEQQLDEAMTADDAPEGILWMPEINLKTLVEDQLLMAIPFAPRHDDCDNALLTRANQDQANPFAQLAGLKSGH
ncbi:DUF177 domain-containing protein [Snodgrassella sp. CFCC 13594]|uniref:YceD family protein n=1 Tax=Snodgrassella sp. CFCC 13594 TaxID=1775559 RepID=UPI00082FB40B|nr:YceD family protein [Snodgrassella sp. CFCC 13594]